MLESLLKKYWKYDTFRPLQREIILSILQENDTLALLPTGGGKSLCYQLPALVKEGVCLVFSPLVALMKDQVDQLKARGISAVALHAGLNRREIEFELQNTLNGKYKLVYLSPERATTRLFRDYVAQIPLSFIVVDEAHCISQWGHQFRPEYLRIGELRKDFQELHFLALTATANATVIKDIKKYLGFKSRSNEFRASFHRSNLSYLVFREQNKKERIHLILSRMKGSALVYCSTRRVCEEMSAFLNSKGHSSAFYHAGLENELRNQIQQDWIENKIRLVCCTNAFGMGIDKPDVRLVMHHELPAGPESYYQEAGRAGRDGQDAFCLLLHDGLDLNSSQFSLPTSQEIEKVLTSLYNYHQLAFNSGKDGTFPLDVPQFCKSFKLKVPTVMQAMQVLNAQGFLKFSEQLYQPESIRFLVDSEHLYAFQVKHKEHDPLIKAILRSYGGVFDTYVAIKVKDLAQMQKMSIASLRKKLDFLKAEGICDLTQEKSGAYITYLQSRPGKLSFDKKSYLLLLEQAELRKQKMKEYCANLIRCREQVLLEYFDEKRSERCGKCDICRAILKSKTQASEFQKVVEKIREWTKESSMNIEMITRKFRSFDEKHVLEIIRWLLENEYLDRDGDAIRWKEGQG